MPADFKIDTFSFSSEKPLIIAEIGTSHGGSISKAKELICAAKEACANAVKFQIVYADEILHPKSGFVELPTGKILLYERFKELEQKPEFYAELAEYSRKKNLLFSASAFGLKSAEELNNLNPDFFKIASPELNHLPLLKQLAAYGKPVIISTGVSFLSDIEKALLCMKSVSPICEIALLHCITSYPAPETEYNLSVIKNLQNIFGVSTGVSDHSLNPIFIPVLALCFGAAIIEKHICLSRKENGLDDPVALEPEMFKTMVKTVNECLSKTENEIITFLKNSGIKEEIIYAAIGTGKKIPAESEIKNLGRTNRSLHYLKDLKKGSIISKNDVGILRTEKELSVGIHPEMFEILTNSILQKNVNSGDGVKLEDFIQKAE